MGIAKGIGWALGLYESDEHYQKRLNKWNKKQNDQFEITKRLVIYELKENGYKGAMKHLEWKNEAPSYNYNIPVTIKQIWATKPETREKETNLTFEEYYQKLEQKNNKNQLIDNDLLLVKDQQILKLKSLLEKKEKINNEYCDMIKNKILPVLDQFNKALKVENPSAEVKNFLNGFQMIYNQFFSILKNEKLTDKEKEILQLKVRLAELEKKRNE